MDPISRQISSVTVAAEKTDNLAERIKDSIAAACQPLIGPILKAVDTAVRITEKISLLEFRILRTAGKDHNLAAAMFSYMEGMIMQHRAIMLAGGKEKFDLLTPTQRSEVTPKDVKSIPGLSSWAVNKSMFMRGYEVKALNEHTGKTLVVGSLDPTEEQYAGDDGHRVWLENIEALQRASKDAWAAEHKKAREGRGVIVDDASPSKGNGNDSQDVVKLSDMLKAGQSVLTQAIHEANKFSDNGLHSTVNSICNQAAREIERAIVHYKEKRKAELLAGNKPTLTTAQAEEMRLRLLSAKNDSEGEELELATDIQGSDEFTDDQLEAMAS